MVIVGRVSAFAMDASIHGSVFLECLRCGETRKATAFITLDPGRMEQLAIVTTEEGAQMKFQVSIPPNTVGSTQQEHQRRQILCICYQSSLNSRNRNLRSRRQSPPRRARIVASTSNHAEGRNTPSHRTFEIRVRNFEGQSIVDR